MKFKFVLIIGAIVFLASLSFPQEIKLVNGTKLIYNLQRDGENYDLTITINSLNPDRTLSYQMSDEKNTHGELVLTQEALKNSKQIITFLLGSKSILKKSLAFWLSDSSYNQLLKNDSTELKLDDGTNFTLRNMTTSVRKVVYNNETLYVNYISAAQVSHNDLQDLSIGFTFQILEDKNNPLILSADLGNIGWELSLKEIKNPKS